MNKYDDMNLIELEEIQDKLENDINNFKTDFFEMVYPQYIMGFEIKPEEYEEIENNIRKVDNEASSMVLSILSYIGRNSENISEKTTEPDEEETQEYKQSLVDRRNQLIKDYNTFRSICSEKSDIFNEIKKRRLGMKI